MQLTAIEDGAISVVAFEGNLDTNTSPEAEAFLDDLLQKGIQKLVIDFQKLEYVSSAGLRVLLGLAKKMSGSGGEIRLCGLNKTVREVFDVSGFSTLMKIVDNRSEATTDLS